jgi:ribonuclease HI
MIEVTIYTDGSCPNNRGANPGAWAAILMFADGTEKEISGGEPSTTNQQMEIQAAIEGLKALPGPSKVRIVTDSEYVKKANMDGWLAKWQRNGWKNAARDPVANQDRWLALLEAKKGHDVTFEWVKGHANDAINERCDRLAAAAVPKG